MEEQKREEYIKEILEDCRKINDQEHKESQKQRWELLKHWREKYSNNEHLMIRCKVFEASLLLNEAIDMHHEYVNTFNNIDIDFNIKNLYENTHENVCLVYDRIRLEEASSYLDNLFRKMDHSG